MEDTAVFIVGANGQLGTALRRLYPNSQSADIDELDITDASSVAKFDWTGIKVIINAAAYTNVDGAETPEGRVASWKVNASAVAHLAETAVKHDMTLVHISSDYVFDGEKPLHMEDEDFSPLGVYGQSKAGGDIAAGLVPRHYIVRTSWVIGEGNNFVRTMKSLADRGITPGVVDDQRGRLTFTSTLADAIKHLVDNEVPHGTYNLTNSGDVVSWADIAKLVYEKSGKSESDVTPVTTAEYYAGKDGIAPRPLNSELSLDKITATGFAIPDWRNVLDEYWQTIKED